MSSISRIFLWVVAATALHLGTVILSPYQRASANEFFDPSLLQDFNAIVGGEPANIRDVPYAAAIFRHHSNGNVTYICSASVVSETYVVTAAHCVIDEISGLQVRASELSVRIGTAALSAGLGETIAVEESIPHPEFKFIDYTNDIALLSLAEAVDVEPIALPAAGLSDELFPGNGDSGTVSGWGQTSQGGDRSNVLNSVELPVVSHLRCLPIFQSSLRLDHKFCAGGLQEEVRDACLGDSGGPLAVNRNGEAVLAGVVSSGRGCGLPGIPGVYTRVSHFSDWLIENSGGDLAPETFAVFDDEGESTAATILEDSSPISNTVNLGEVSIFAVENSRVIELTTLSGDADLFVYDDVALEKGEPICVSQSFDDVDECEIESTTGSMTAVVFGFEDSAFTIEAKGAVLEPRNDDSPQAAGADEPLVDATVSPGVSAPPLDDDATAVDELELAEDADTDIVETTVDDSESESAGEDENEEPAEAIVVAEADTGEIPETVTPVVDTPGVEPPVAEVPVVEPPVAEVPVVEPPVAEMPVVEPPVAEVPVVEPPVAEVPVVEPPVVEVPVPSPVVEIPEVEPPVAEVPAVEPPVVDVPVVEVPAVETPVETPVVVVLPPVPTQTDTQPVDDGNPTPGEFLESEINPTVPANTDIAVAEPTPIQTQPPVAVTVPVETGGGGGGATAPVVLLFWLMFLVSRSFRWLPSSLRCIYKLKR